MQNVADSSVVHEPVQKPGFELVDEVDLINIVLIQRLGRRRSTAIPDDALWVDARDEERQSVVLDVVYYMAVGLVATFGELAIRFHFESRDEP